MCESIANKFICVHYPAVVKNVPKAIDALGGLSAVAHACYNSQNLRLRFNPHNIYAKPIYGQATHTAGLVIKVKVRRNKRSKQIVSTTSSVLGKVEKIYEFKGLFDFQFLPMAPKPECSGKESGDMTCILHELLPEDLPNTEWLNYPAPLFLQPNQFSRTDLIHHIYSFQDSTDGEKMSLEEAMQVSTRESRHKPLARINFTLTDDFPTKPSDEVAESAKTKSFNDTDINTLKELFEEQPIWSLRGLMYKSGLKYGVVNGILPLLSVSYLNGPWRRTHVKLGYDPRKNPQARAYQTVDFRMKNSFHLLPNMPRKRGNIGRIKGKAIQTNDQHSDNIETDDNSYIFNVGQIPPKKQMMFQFCNIKVPIVEEMMARLPALLPGALCHEKSGWLPAGFEDSVRDVLTHLVREEIRKRLTDKNVKVMSESMIAEKDVTDDSSDTEED